MINIMASINDIVINEIKNKLHNSNINIEIINKYIQTKEIDYTMHKGQLVINNFMISTSTAFIEFSFIYNKLQFRFSKSINNLFVTSIEHICNIINDTYNLIIHIIDYIQSRVNVQIVCINPLHNVFAINNLYMMFDINYTKIDIVGSNDFVKIENIENINYDALNELLFNIKLK